MLIVRAFTVLSLGATLLIGGCGDDDPHDRDLLPSNPGSNAGGTTGDASGATANGTSGTTGSGTTGNVDGGTGGNASGMMNGTGGNGTVVPGNNGGTTNDGGTTNGATGMNGDVNGGTTNGGNAAACTGKPGEKVGKVTATVQAGGMQRRFIYYAPEGLDPNQPTPLVISPHGFTMTGENMYQLTGFKELADEEGFVAIFPEGGDALAPWNVGQGVTGAGALVAATHDDQAFVDAMLEYVDADRCLDREHIFVSGFSMGGYFSNEVACLRSDIAGVAPHSGGSHDLGNCPGSLKPVMILHGTEDWLIVYNENAEVTRDRWIQRNGCSTASDAVPVRNGTCEYYRDCMPGAQVAMCSFDGLNHVWAGGNPHLFSDTNFDDASRLAWEFWKEYAW